jgi:hypothetical protein
MFMTTGTELDKDTDMITVIDINIDTFSNIKKLDVDNKINPISNIMSETCSLQSDLTGYDISLSLIFTKDIGPSAHL